MKTVANILFVVAILTFIVAIISRLTMTPLSVIPGGLEAEALLSLTNTCLLIAVVLLLQNTTKGK